jgi:hypothetical protein
MRPTVRRAPATLITVMLDELNRLRHNPVRAILVATVTGVTVRN